MIWNKLKIAVCGLIIICLTAALPEAGYTNYGGAADLPVDDPSVAGKHIPILMYHAISDVPWSEEIDMFVRPSELDEQLKFLTDDGYQCVTFEDLDKISAYAKPLMLTFDDGYKCNYDVLFPLLQKYGLKATIFVITKAVGSKRYVSAENMREMSDSGFVSIQSHTASHNDLTAIGPNDLREELTSSKAFIETVTGKAAIALSYPMGIYDTTVRAAAIGHYDYAVCVDPGKFRCGADRYTMRRISIDRGMSIKAFASAIR